MLSNLWQGDAPPDGKTRQLLSTPQGPAASAMQAPSPLLTALGQQPNEARPTPEASTSPLLGALNQMPGASQSLPSAPQNQVAPQAGGVWNAAAGWTAPGYAAPTQQQGAAHQAAMNRPGHR